MHGTRKEIEMILKLRIEYIIVLNENIKKEFSYESSYLSEDDKNKMLRRKKLN